MLLASCSADDDSGSYSRKEFSYSSYPAQGTRGFYTLGKCTEIEIDHVVSLKDAWFSGARHWSSQQKKRFANDRRNHVSACKTINRSKGSAGPSLFLSRATDGKGKDYKIVNWCVYLQRYAEIKDTYELKVSEQTIDLLDKCSQGENEL